MALSKNRLRKNRRAEYHRAVNDVSESMDCDESAKKVAALQDIFFRNVDVALDNMDLDDPFDKRDDEYKFLKGIIRNIEENGWVTVCRNGITPLQVKAGIYDYISARLSSGEDAGEVASKSDRDRAEAARYLFGKAIRLIQPKRI